jgi:hypothetical protein
MIVAQPLSTKVDYTEIRTATMSAIITRQNEKNEWKKNLIELSLTDCKARVFGLR